MPSFLLKRKNLIILIALILFQMILISIQVPVGEKETLLERSLFAVFAPIQNGVISIFRGIGEIWDRYFELRGVEEHNRRLIEENFVLKQQNILLKRSLRRYQDEEFLRELYQTLSENVVGARVSGMDTENLYNSVVINRGSWDGLALNHVVLDDAGNLVGRVTRTAWKQATVQLITDEKSGVSVMPLQGGSVSILKGAGGYLCSLDYSLTTDESPVPGDILVTSGYDHIYPPGIRVGRVLSVDKQPALFKDVKVRPFFRLQDLDRLAVISIDPDLFH